MRASGRLTAREVEILTLVPRGLTDREIAAVLDISRRTVSQHVGDIITILNARSRSHAVAKAIRGAILLDED